MRKLYYRTKVQRRGKILNKPIDINNTPVIIFFD